MSIRSFVRTFAVGVAITASAAVFADSLFAQGSMRYPAAQNGQNQMPVANPVYVPTPAQPNGQSGVVNAVGSGVPEGGQVRQASHVTASPMMQSANPMLQSQRQLGPGKPSRGQYASMRGNPMPMGRQGVVQAGYSGPRVRAAQMISEVPLSSGAGMVMDPSMSNDGGAPVGQNYLEAYDDGGYVDGGYVDGGCDSCDLGGCDSCCDRGGCPPGLIGDCWINGLGGILYRADYFAGVQCWDSPVFNDSTASDYNGGSGFYVGANLGVPLCRLTCGLFSGQIGVRATQSEINGSPNVSQIFATGGFYRRVDCGLQFGAVADYLQEDFFFNAQLMQVRGDLSWVYAGGNSLGFRAAIGIQDAQVPDVIPGAGANQFRLQTLDNYRVYYRSNCVAGGFSDLFIGWTDDSHVLSGLDVDMPITECVALQAGTTYALPTANANVMGGNANDAWNLYVGFVFRPQGRCWYQNYDRPIMPVADNGSMIVRRGF